MEVKCESDADISNKVRSGYRSGREENAEVDLRYSNGHGRCASLILLVRHEK